MTWRQGIFLVVAAACLALMLLLPRWEIQHPADPSLVIRTEHHWLWKAPSHARVDSLDTIFNCLIVVLIATPVLVLARAQNDRR
jgi:hypothetical protein